MQLTTNDSILYDFKHKNHQNMLIDSLKAVFLSLNSHFERLKTVKKVLHGGHPTKSLKRPICLIFERTSFFEILALFTVMT